MQWFCLAAFDVALNSRPAYEMCRAWWKPVPVTFAWCGFDCCRYNLLCELAALQPGWSEQLDNATSETLAVWLCSRCALLTYSYLI